MIDSDELATMNN